MDRRPVLVATDLYADGAEALRQGHHWACAEERPLWVVLELPRPDTISLLFPHEAQPMVDADRRLAAERQLREHVEEVLGPVEYQLALTVDGETEGPSVDQIAREIDAAVLVIGTSNKSEATRALIGQHAEPIIDDAPCPVLVARRSRDSGPVVAMAEPAHDSPVLDQAHAAALVWKRGLAVLLAREGALPAVARDLAPKDRGDGAAELESGRIIVDSELRRRGILADLRTALGDPVSAARQLGEQLHPSLLVVRAPGPMGEPEAVVARALVNEAPCSVLVLH